MRVPATALLPLPVNPKCCTYSMNPRKKTKIEVFRGKSVGISRTLEDIQTNVSGPVSNEDAEIHLGQLESLLALSSSEAEDQSEGSGRFNRLAAIEKGIFDVREDTLK